MASLLSIKPLSLIRFLSMKLYKILWKSLPQNMVELPSLASFKDRLAKHFRNRKMIFKGFCNVYYGNPDHLEEFSLWSRVIERKK